MHSPPGVSQCRRVGLDGWKKRKGLSMQAEVKGSTLPVLEMILDPGESLISNHGELSWMTANMQMSQTTAMGNQGWRRGRPARRAEARDERHEHLPHPLRAGRRPGHDRLRGQDARTHLPARGQPGGQRRVPRPQARLGLRNAEHQLHDRVQPGTRRDALRPRRASSSRSWRARARPGSSCPVRSRLTTSHLGRACSSTRATSGSSRTPSPSR